MEVTGHPIVHLFAESTARDGAVHVYLEDVDPAGRVTMVTEGQLRLLHRKLSDAQPPYRSVVPYHSYEKAQQQEYFFHVPPPPTGTDPLGKRPVRLWRFPENIRLSP